MCNCIDCAYINICHKKIINRYDDCSDFVNEQDFDDSNDRWIEMSYKKFTGRRCSSSLEELEEELEKEE
jgi:hypothetical protein